MAKSKKKNSKFFLGLLAGIVAGMLGMIIVNYILNVYLLGQ